MSDRPQSDTPSNSSSRLGEYQSERDMDAFWAEVKPEREPMQQRWFLPAILAILTISVPWYWKTGATGPIILGLPSWIWVALGCSLGVSTITALMALRYWRDDEYENDEGG